MMAAFDYESAKTQFGAGRAREMEKEFSAQPAPAPAAPAAPTNFPPPPTTGGNTGFMPPRTSGTAPQPAPAPPPSGGAAQSYFNQQSAGDQAAIRQSWGGKDMLGEWYSNAVKAGATGPGTANDPLATSGGQAQAGGGTTRYTGPADTTKWQTGTAMTNDAHPDATTQSGDPFVDMIRGSAQGSSEDFGRFSHAQVLAWRDKYDAAASKAAGRPQFRNDFGDLVDKPTESGPQSQAAGFATGEKSAGRGGGGGAGGGGGVGGGSSTSSTVATSTPGAGGDLSSMMEANLKKMLAGDTSRYSPEAMQGLLAQIKQRIESSKSTQLRQAESEAAGRGMSRSGRTGTNLGAIRRGAEAEFTGQYGNTLRAKIDADRQDKNDALDRGQKYLDSMRDELYRRDMSAIQRQQYKANLDLAYANLANQRQALASSQQHSKDMLGAQYGYQATFGST